MEIRQAQESDIPAIVELLKLSLGETLMPKSEAFWRWKHLDNAFGKSPVLLAFEGNLLVGVRAFMRWEWRQGEKIYKAVRAVDTATHPEFQGKGIFKTLTLQLADQCQREGVDFIFNTPNKDSKPGYLKMGWTEVGRLQVGIRPIINWRGTTVEGNNFGWDDALLQRVWETDSSQSEAFLSTSRSLSFFQWRYRDNPNVRYHMVGNGSQDFLVIFRIKKNRLFTEFRICEMIGDRRKLSLQTLVEAARQCRATAITCSGFSPAFRSVTLAAGPEVTIRMLNAASSLTFESWKPTMGDMEVF